MTQAKRPGSAWRRAALVWIGAASLAVCTLALVFSGCEQKTLLDMSQRPGTARCVYWTWPELDPADLLTPSEPVTRRWDEFLRASRDHKVLIHDFLFLEGHPETVGPTWDRNVVPPVTGPDYLNYRSAGRWHVVHRRFAPDSMSLYYLRVPGRRLIDNADARAWRFPRGAELVQLLYHHKWTGDTRGAGAELVEWRAMLHAGPGCGQMRTDGSRSDWVFESAIRDPADGLWQRTREDGRDLTWTRLGKLGHRFRWPVIRPHTCAECHRLAGRSPLDGPRGGNEVYSLGDLQEVVWTRQLRALVPLLKYPMGATTGRADPRQPRPPDAAERYRLYLDLLSRQRSEVFADTRAQQKTVRKSPFETGDTDAVARGREIYLTQCGVCHGGEARGGGPLALRTPPPPSIRRTGTGRFLKVVRQGRGPMPPWNDVLPGDEQWRLIEYLRTPE